MIAFMMTMLMTSLGIMNVVFDAIIVIIVIISIFFIIIIITRPWPAFGRLGLGVSSEGYSSHG